ncbi:hypothetical protein DV737_g416, partial [Chaetothyriales sp. CBS 132003]
MEKLEACISEVQTVKCEGSAITTHSTGSLLADDEAWRQLRTELESVGITPAIFNQHRKLILPRLLKGISEGDLIEATEDWLSDTILEADSKDDLYGRTPLSWASRNGHEAVVRLLLETGKVDANSKDDLYSQTPLLWAARNGHEAVVRLLLETGTVEADSEDDLYGRTPLWHATQEGHEAVLACTERAEEVASISRLSYEQRILRSFIIQISKASAHSSTRPIAAVSSAIMASQRYYDQVSGDEHSIDLDQPVAKRWSWGQQSFIIRTIIVAVYTLLIAALCSAVVEFRHKDDAAVAVAAPAATSAVADVPVIADKPEADAVVPANSTESTSSDGLTEIQHCGSNWEEATALGCVYDVMMQLWMPPACYDEVLTERYLRDGNWTWWADADASRIMSDEEMREGKHLVAYMIQDYHMQHCVFAMEKLVRALRNQWSVIPELVSYDHIVHCRVNTFMRTEPAEQNNVTLCGTSAFYNSTDSEIPYSFNNNAWGANGSEWGASVSTGFSCLTVGDGGRNFSVTYKWEGDASTVKAFPYAKAWPSNFPVQLRNLSSMPFAASWRTFVSGTEDESVQKQEQAYDNAALRANVAVDIFLSDNATNSTLVGPPIEIMIWPWYTKSIIPLGYTSTPANDTAEVGGVEYSLFQGYNIQGQHVFSWLAHKNLTQVDVDYAPLLSYIVDQGYLGGGLYLGQLEFGTEVMNANDQATFEAWDYSLRIIRHGDPDDPHTATSTATGADKTPAKWEASPPGKIIPFDEVKSEQDLLPPGAAAGTVPTDLEQATGLERLEILGKMRGIDIFDMKPLPSDRLGTFSDPIVVKSGGEELQLGCTGFPADDHVVRWVVVSRDRPYQRCDECGSVYKMEYIGPADDPHHAHHGYTEPKTMADYVKEDYCTASLAWARLTKLNVQLTQDSSRNSRIYVLGLGSGAGTYAYVPVASVLLIFDMMYVDDT